VSKISTVMRNEYLRAVRTKAFILGVLLTPVLFGASIIIMAIAENNKDLTDRHFAVVDRSGMLGAVIEQAMQARNEHQLYDKDDPEEQVKPRWIPEIWNPADHPDERADVVLSQRVDDGDLIGFLSIGADIPALDGDDRELAWFTDTPTYNDLPSALGQTVNNTVRHHRLTSSDMDAELIAKLSKSVKMTTMGLVEVDTDGTVHEAEETDKFAEIGVPVGLAFLLFMLVMMSTPALMNNVLEEKMQRIAEVLVSSVSPFQLLMGKLLSAVLVSLTLGVIYLGGVLIFVHNFDKVPPAVVEALDLNTLLLFVLFLVMSLMIYGSVFAGLGAACSEIQDTQTLIMPAMLFLIMPIMFIGPVIESPDGTLATLLSFFPPATPMIMFMRAGIPPGVDWWELPLAIVLCTGFCIVSVWAASRVFRVGILMQGKAPTWRQMWGWIRAG
jgi:ABC-2 type transport system permease protein